MKSIVLPAGTEHVQFGELAHLIAIALHPLGDNPTDSEMMAYGGARINLDAELLQAVKVGTLSVKDPLTLGPHTFPVGDALRRSRVMVDDLRQFVAGRLSVEIAQTAAPVPVVVASDGPAPLPAVPNWKMLIQAEAAAYCLRLRQSGASPTKHSILDQMAKWCRDNNVKTDTKIFPSANYLRTHVLGGKHWDVPN